MRDRGKAVNKGREKVSDILGSSLFLLMEPLGKLCL